MRSPAPDRARAFRMHRGNRNDDEGAASLVPSMFQASASPRRNVKDLYSPTGVSNSRPRATGRRASAPMMPSPPYGGDDPQSPGPVGLRHVGDRHRRGSHHQHHPTARSHDGAGAGSAAAEDNPYECMFELFPEKTRIEYLEDEDDIAASFYASSTSNTNPDLDDDDVTNDTGGAVASFASRRSRRDGHSGYDWDSLIHNR
eukprot:CAMPEP_0198135972 /NCGR_PEP_ID=MMETSP1442-20131203/60868_1 /TAXON_ID= /ORGANISM="Craspedostauros australis, Strain CCMP3328" /LENGTH=200 /DNA_ID=CAMNT_0043797165 /DNA_START=405 /DNA_END=1007 /DNA_ORIENTATION=+